jgi:hypothetical protein
MAASRADAVHRFWLYAMSDGVPRRSFVVAVVVGTILNLINQGDALVAGERLNLVKLVLTYIVPYLVTTYGAVSFRLHADRQAGSDGASSLAPRR